MLNPAIDSETTSYLPSSEKIIDGHPLQKAWVFYENSNNQFSSGIWQSEVGKWNVQFSEDEYCFILSGTSIVTDSEGNSQTVRPGDHFVINAGFKGTWEVTETCRKVFVACEAVASA